MYADTRSWAAKFLKNRGYEKSVLEAIYYHHENYDGSGYPENLEGENIPLSSRILRVCDTYAALTENVLTEMLSDVLRQWG